MALLRKLFYRKPPDGLLEISERVYVLDCCFTTDCSEEKNFKGYVAGIVSQLREQFPDAALLVFNFREAEAETSMSKIMSEYDMTIMDYPRNYEGCPILSMELIHHFLRSTESWLALGPLNVLLMHCEQGGWPVLAFMLAALLIYRKQYTGELRTLDMVYKQAPRELLPSLSPQNPIPSQLRYLQYVSRRNVVSQWPPLDRALTLDCIIIRLIPDFDGNGGCRPLFRIYGQDPFNGDDRAPKLLFSTPKKGKAVRLYKQAESELVKIDINCNIQGDVVLECTSLHNDMEHEDLMFRIMFNTAFIRSNILMLNRNEIDTLWHMKDHFPKDFRAEVLFSDMNAAGSVVAANMSCFEEKEGLPVEAFAKVQEFFSHVDWLDSRADAALSVLQKISASRSSQENLDFATVQGAESGTSFHRSSPQKSKEGHMLNMDVGHPGGDASKVVSASVPVQLPQQPHITELEVKLPPTQVLTCLEDAFQSLVLSSQSKSQAPPDPVLPLPTIDVMEGNSIDGRLLPRQPLPPAGTASGQEVLRKGYEAMLPPPTMEVPSTTLVDKDSHVTAGVQPGHSSHSAGVGPQPPLSASQQPTLSRPESTFGAPLPAPLPLRGRTPPPPPLPQPLPTPSLYEKSAGDNALPHSIMPDASIQNSNNSLIKVRPAPPPLPPAQPSKSSAGQAGLQPPPLPPPLPSKWNFGKVDPLPSVPPHQQFRSSSPSSITPPPPCPIFQQSGPLNNSSVPSPPPPPGATSQQCGSSSPALPPPPPPPFSGATAQQCGLSSSPSVSPTPPPPSHGAATSQPCYLSSSSAVPPPPPPPSATSQQSGPSSSSSVPPPPPPPGPTSSSVPCAPPPPIGFDKGAPKTGSVPAPVPPSSSPLNLRGRSLSRSSGPKNSQTKKLKPLHWLKLTRAVQGSLWAETQKSGEASSAPEIDMSELENLFSASVPNSDRGGSCAKTMRGATAPKSDKVQLIDHRRAYNCEIMLSKVKVPLQELMGSVLTLEESTLDVDQVDNLIKFCPTKEEMELLKGYKGEVDKLGKCEQFFLELMRVPRVEAKLRVFSFKMQFNNQVSDLRKSLNNVKSAADQIRSSVKLKRIMQTVLSLGNALNQGTARGSAVGFRLDSLLKLTETRARNNKMTLMHYLCKVIGEKLPELLDFSKDLTSMEPASKIQLKFLAEEMQAINKGLEKVVQELSMSENDGPVSEEFRKNLKEFLCFAEAEVRSLALLYSGVGRNVDALIVYFGEDPARCPFEQVVSTLLNFTKMFNRAHEENCKQLELEKKRAEKDLENQKLSAQNESTSFVSSPSKGGKIK